MWPFLYPVAKNQRRHGPNYGAYASYRDWLRDEFQYRCVYCLTRERFFNSLTLFEIDHFQAQSSAPSLIADYDNLYYSCRSCNLAKGKQPLPRPCESLIRSSITVHADGTITGNTPDARRIILKLGLDCTEFNTFRRSIIAFAEIEPLSEKFSYPERLPNLVKKRVVNSRPFGLLTSAYTLRMLGALPEIY